MTNHWMPEFTTTAEEFGDLLTHPVPSSISSRTVEGEETTR